MHNSYRWSFFFFKFNFAKLCTYKKLLLYEKIYANCKVVFKSKINGTTATATATTGDEKKNIYIQNKNY